jgi:hypothetical protein
MPTRTIKMTLEFNEDDLNRILKDSYFGQGNAPKVSELTAAQFKQFKKELTETETFKEELLEGTREAAANDWLCDLMQQFE